MGCPEEWIPVADKACVYSIRTIIDDLHTKLIDFIVNLSPGVIVLILLTSIGTMMVLLFMSVRKQIRRVTR